jgi:hypothetical protein
MTQQNNNPIAIYDIAAKHCQTIQVCIDRLHELGANHQLKLLTGRLQRLAFRATPVEEGHDNDTTTAADPIFAAIEAHRDAHLARAALFGTCRSTERQRKPRTCRGFR